LSGLYRRDDDKIGTDGLGFESFGEVVGRYAE
jgi:hypothetical protein